MALNELYQQAIKTHSKNPIGKDLSFEATHRAEGYNPSCGDELSVYLTLNKESDKVTHIGFTGDACAICIASASLMCQHAPGKKTTALINDLNLLSQSLHERSDLTIETLNCLTAVSKHPSRINCALLPWKTLQQSFQNPGASFIENEK
ncbi:SUF system NifU family Fe-S cluster assembly protein [Aliikangiella marina]|uniref:SUF system NifU family Fe-S cluster assembly protein n=1 Tax=Aliikangiella marina TaxID=1712262 RepID=A0A545T6Z5_9GAMM|nr:SUF system NifU family Fe-S cluster assembly protein [Aliikangiella marina]TQV72955.1 SUF system NifU family Fe-S cluster assembly protein [Aliikangiella marina]